MRSTMTFKSLHYFDFVCSCANSSTQFHISSAKHVMLCINQGKSLRQRNQCWYILVADFVHQCQRELTKSQTHSAVTHLPNLICFCFLFFWGAGGDLFYGVFFVGDFIFVCCCAHNKHIPYTGFLHLLKLCSCCACCTCSNFYFLDSEV